MHQVKVDQFEGPLDLLLQLIEQQKLDITKVALAQVTEQYIRAIEGRSESIEAAELADFLAIAAKLLLLKSKALMPYLVWDDEEEEDDLERQLKMYKEYFEASKKLQSIIAKKKFGYFREKFFVVSDIGFQPPKNAEKSRLSQIFREIIDNLAPLEPLKKSTIRSSVSLQERIFDIRNKILTGAKVSFQRILKESKDKTEVIVNFLAMLELMKQREVSVHQEGLFREIIIERTNKEQ